ncbi:DoxX family membrane protein [Leptospira yanagawae]|uniref:DoxX family membrane protein n=1 Tax=Leptospira yanagawae TaxID=293069 RepID=A0ABY2M5H3_9LEPT|nr:DoxX family protein [Leptospira yanagawae]TGL24460.1 DoxX family membrane protein [Leptospira yanagawae]
MTVFAILIITFGLLTLLSLLGIKTLSNFQLRGRIATAIMFAFAGILHFVKPDIFLKMMPVYFPWPYELVLISGVAEIVGGIGLLFPSVSRFAAWGLILLLLSVFPANVNVAIHNIQLGGYMSNSLYQWLRLPFQFVLIFWIYYFSIRKQKTT